MQNIFNENGNTRTPNTKRIYFDHTKCCSRLEWIKIKAKSQIVFQFVDNLLKTKSLEKAL